MNYETFERYRRLVRDNESYPVATESLKQRIILAATRARLRQRRFRQLVPVACLFLFMVVSVSNSEISNSFLEFTTGETELIHAGFQVDNEPARSKSQWDQLTNENDLVDAFILKRNWQSNLFRNRITHL